MLLNADGDSSVTPTGKTFISPLRSAALCATMTSNSGAKAAAFQLVTLELREKHGSDFPYLKALRLEGPPCDCTRKLS